VSPGKSTVRASLARAASIAVERQAATYTLARRLDDVTQEGMRKNIIFTCDYLRRALADANSFIIREIERIAGSPTVDEHGRVHTTDLSRSLRAAFPSE